MSTGGLITVGAPRPFRAYPSSGVAFLLMGCGGGGGPCSEEIDVNTSGPKSIRPPCGSSFFFQKARAG